MKRLAPIALVAALSVSGCASNSSRVSSTAGDALAVAAGSAAAYSLSDQNAAVGVAGGVAALGIKRYADYVADNKRREEIQKAYDTAHARATRELYDAIQRQQSEPTAESDAVATVTDESTYLPVVLPERVVNGAVIEPSLEYVRINDTPSGTK